MLTVAQLLEQIPKRADPPPDKPDKPDTRPQMSGLSAMSGGVLAKNKSEVGIHARPLAACWWRWGDLLATAKAAGHRPAEVEAMIEDAIPSACPLDRRDSVALDAERTVRSRLHLIVGGSR